MISFQTVHVFGLDIDPVALVIVIAGFLCLIWALIRSVSDSRWLLAYFSICFLLAGFVSYLYGHPAP